MPAVVEAESTLTDRYQTTVPEAVRQALSLSKRDKIHYTIHPNGDVVLSRASSDEEDPVLLGFLNFLAEDMRQHPERLEALDQSVLERVNALVGGMTVDLNTPLSAADE